MVSSLLASALSDPTTTLKTLYTSHRGSEDFPRVVSEYFRAIFSADSDLHQIHDLHAHKGVPLRVLAQDRPLVRFRTMVQSYEHEVYRSILPHGQLGGWGLAEDYQGDEVDDDRLISSLGDRTSAWCVSVPGESSWVVEELCGEDEGTGTGVPRPTSDVKSHKFPIKGKEHLGINVKICGDPDDTLKLTDVHTFIGILCVSPSATSLHDGDQENVLTLHVLFSYPHPTTIVQFPYPMQSALPTEVTQYMQETEGPPGSQALTDVRSELIDWLATEGLAGDREAAEWILLLAAARVHSRTPPILPLSVALSSFPPPPSTPSASAEMPVLEPTLNHVLSLIFPNVVHLPLSISFLNGTSFLPKSIEEDLHSGFLQLPRGTTVLVSDGAVSEGTLNNTGVLNVQALKQCISSQTIAYSFPYSDFTFNTELTFLVLTQDTKSPFVETDVNVPLRPTLESSRFALYKAADRIRLPAPEKLGRFRQLIGGAKTGKVTVGDDVSEYIQTDFVRERQQVQGINSDDLVLRMSVARLMTLSFHEPGMTKDIWEKTKVLDNKRKARVSGASA